MPIGERIVGPWRSERGSSADIFYLPAPKFPQSTPEVTGSELTTLENYVGGWLKLFKDYPQFFHTKTHRMYTKQPQNGQEQLRSLYLVPKPPENYNSVAHTVADICLEHLAYAIRICNRSGVSFEDQDLVLQNFPHLRVHIRQLTDSQANSSYKH